MVLIVCLCRRVDQLCANCGQTAVPPATTAVPAPPCSQVADIGPVIAEEQQFGVFLRGQQNKEQSEVKHAAHTKTHPQAHPISGLELLLYTCRAQGDMKDEAQTDNSTKLDNTASGHCA
jgi:hypothetical protein